MVFANGTRVGTLKREADGEITFQYHDEWLNWDGAAPVSLSLPLKPKVFMGETVSAVFDNLMPDERPLRRQVAQRVGALGDDAYSLLAAIGRDCVGALQFIPEGEDLPEPDHRLTGKTLNERDVEGILNGLAQAPLGLGPEDDFRISVAGAQEKTALLFRRGRWVRPSGTTPTTHILKPPIGTTLGGLDLSGSVENEFYCLTLLAAMGLPVTRASISHFGETRALVVERFDRQWISRTALIRLPQEDLCQAFGIPPSRKYQSHGGPGLVNILKFLTASNRPDHDRLVVLQAQMIFWLIGATDGHAKNFSIFLGSAGRFQLTPLYDVMTVQPLVSASRIRRNQFKLALSVGNSGKYRVADITGRHFVESAIAAGMGKALIRQATQSVIERLPGALETVERDLSADVLEGLHEPVAQAALKRLSGLKAALRSL